MHIRAVWVAGDQLADIELEARLTTPGEVYALEVRLRRVLEGLVAQQGGPVPTLIDFNQLHIERDEAQRFGRMVAEVRETFMSVVAYWGTVAATRQVLAVEAMAAKHAANLFDERNAAVAFLRKVRRGEIIATHHRSSVPPGK